MLIVVQNRHLPWSRLLAFLQSLARSGWVEEGFHRARVYPVGVLGDDGADVYIWEEGEDVDCEEELDGEVLMGGISFESVTWLFGLDWIGLGCICVVLYVHTGLGGSTVHCAWDGVAWQVASPSALSH